MSSFDAFRGLVLVILFRLCVAAQIAHVCEAVAASR